MTGPEYYNWHGMPVSVEVWDATDAEISIHYTEPEHDTGTVPAGEIHFIVWPAWMQPSDGWWATEATFWEHADPVSPAAIKRAEGRR